VAYVFGILDFSALAQTVLTRVADSTAINIVTHRPSTTNLLIFYIVQRPPAAVYKQQNAFMSSFAVMWNDHILRPTNAQFVASDSVRREKLETRLEFHENFSESLHSGDKGGFWF
jgi:hypothetical protein